MTKEIQDVLKWELINCIILHFHLGHKWQHRSPQLTGHVSVGYSIFKTSRANLCTGINR